MKAKLMKFIALIILITVNSTELKAQENYETGKILVIVNDNKIIPEKGGKSSNVEFENILQEFNINSIRQVMPFARTIELTRLYELNTSKNIDSMIVRLQQLNVSQNLFYSIEKCFKPQPLYDPSDYMWWLTLNNNPNNDSWLWYLKKIEADKAWNITKGDANIKVAVIDDGIDPLHPDLVGKIDPPYNFHTGTPFSPQSHGTSVGTILAAETVDQGQTPNGQMASIGYNTKIMFNSWDNGVEACVYASTVMKAKVISISWMFGCSPTTSMLLAEQEILNNGTTIIRAAGNGNQHCGGQRLYPFSGYEDDRTIVVTSVGSDDKHYNGPNTNSHYPSVDVSAPGYSLMGGTSTDGGTNSWPYYGSWGGTSQSTPIVSGLAALILSVNNCLESQDIQIILKSTTDPIVDVSSYPGMVGTGRINAYKAVLMASTYGEVAPITSNTTWSGDKFINDELIIEQGATLTITGTVRFSANSRVIVKQGGKLILDGGKLTNSNGCDDFWQGIEVYGTSNQHQYPSNSPTYQGMLIVKNGGIIENAHIGATNWKKDDYTKIGGVIQANGGVFRNNRRDVVFMAYSNFSETNPAIKRANLSYFNNTDFLSDNNFIEKGLAIQSHVSMWQVSGINFTNCRFANNVTNKLNSTAPNTAISSIDAGYKIDAACSTTPPLGQPCPSGNLLKSSFTGFNTAIDANGSGTTETVTIQQSNFTNNVNGIRIDDFDNVSINRNTINIGSAGYPFFLQGTGISLTNSTGYIVEENTISKTAVTPTYGIAVNNSGTSNNRLYKNTLNALSYGNHFSGVNKNFVLMGTNTGLQFLCNNYSGNTVGTYIGGASDWTHGVNISQGESSKSAGNVFSGNTNSIYNSANWTINYYHHGGTSIPTSNVGSVTLYTATANTCPSSFGGGLILMKGQSNGYLDSLENQSQNLKTTYNELYYTYLSQLDGGNTEKLKAKIENNWSEDAWILRANLLEKSPYLSAEILLETAQLGTLPNAMLLEICMANPDATKSAYFTEKLNEVTNGTFPQYMQEYIRTNDQKTARTQLESQMASVYSELSTTKNFIKNSKATKDEYTTADRYNLSANGKELSDKIAQIDFFIENSQWTKADSVLQIIQNDKTYQDNLSLLEDFDKYIAFRAGLGERTLAELKAYEISFLQELAVKEQRISGYARNILCYFYQLCYDKEYTDDHATQKIMLQKEQNSYLEPIETTLYSVSIYPNPAKEFVNLSWEILDELKECHYQVVNLNGQLVEKGIIPQNKGELTLDTRNYQNGIYVISVFNGNELKATKKLVVEKMK